MIVRPWYLTKTFHSRFGTDFYAVPIHTRSMACVRLSGIFLGVLSLCAPAWSSTFQFSATGAAVSNGNPENAQANIVIGANTMAIELMNTAGPGELGAISSTLSGIAIKLTGGASNLVLLTASTPGAVDCTAGVAQCSLAALPPSPFQWTLGLSGETYALLAGDGSGKPYAIVNQYITGNTDGIKNGPHNPYLLGPVTFALGFSGTAPTGIEAATFYFGTNSADQLRGVPGVPGGPTVPEPASMALVGSALVGAGWWAKARRRRQNRPLED
jgi:hypothetical protein